MTKLVNEKQPFGYVKEEKMHPSMGNPKGETSKGLGATTEISNVGRDHADSIADKGAGAAARASRNKDNPFWPTGHPRRTA